MAINVVGDADCVLLDLRSAIMALLALRSSREQSRRTSKLPASPSLRRISPVGTRLSIAQSVIFATHSLAVAQHANECTRPTEAKSEHLLRVYLQQLSFRLDSWKPHENLRAAAVQRHKETPSIAPRDWRLLFTFLRHS